MNSSIQIHAIVKSRSNVASTGGRLRVSLRHRWSRINRTCRRYITVFIKCSPISEIVVAILVCGVAWPWRSSSTVTKQAFKKCFKFTYTNNEDLRCMNMGQLIRNKICKTGFTNFYSKTLIQLDNFMCFQQMGRISAQLVPSSVITSALTGSKYDLFWYLPTRMISFRDVTAWCFHSLIWTQFLIPPLAMNALGS